MVLTIFLDTSAVFELIRRPPHLANWIESSSRVNLVTSTIVLQEVLLTASRIDDLPLDLLSNWLKDSISVIEPDINDLVTLKSKLPNNAGGKEVHANDLLILSAASRFADYLVTRDKAQIALAKEFGVNAIEPEGLASAIEAGQ